MSGRDRWIAAALILAIAGSGLFITAYVTGGDRLYEGLSIALAAAALSAAALGWAFWIVPQTQVVDPIEEYPSPPNERAAQAEAMAGDLGAVSRSRALVRLLYAALGAFAAALVVPVRSLGPAPDDALFRTRWQKGTRVIDEGGKLVHVADVNVNAAITIFPEGALDDPQSQAMLVRVPADTPSTAQGYLAYSKLCTHAGCPVALYRAAARQLLCPCHQSVFDVMSDGAVVSGPADHPLPRLPIEVGRDGILRATGGFPEPVGPGFWERG